MAHSHAAKVRGSLAKGTHRERPVLLEEEYPATAAPEGQSKSNKVKKKMNAKARLFGVEDEEEDDDDEEGWERQRGEVVSQLKGLIEADFLEASKSDCDLCRGKLVEPHRLPCGHLYCGLCMETSGRYHRRCQLCDVRWTEIDKPSLAEDLASRLSGPVSDPNRTKPSQTEDITDARRHRAQLATERVVVVYGSKATHLGGKYTITTYLKVEKCPKRDKRSSPASSIKSVEFNINPGYPCAKDGIVKRPNDAKLGYSYTYAMARAYPAYMTVHWTADVPPLHIPYYTTTATGKASPYARIVVDFPPKGTKLPRPRRGETVKFECHGEDEDGLSARDGWVTYRDSGVHSAAQSLPWVSPRAEPGSPACCPTPTSLADSVSETLAAVIAQAKAGLSVPPEAIAGCTGRALARLFDASRRGQEAGGCYARLVQLYNPDLGYDSKATSKGACHERGMGPPQRFFHVAIDCPGYGRSAGDCQTIRSYPGSFLSQVVTALGKKHAYALIGSSQGACAVFNAVLECPGLCRFLSVRDPVGHDTSRYSQIAQPAHLIFDVDDPGHPVKVGRLMHRALPTSSYHEHSSIKEPYYHEDFMASQLLAMFATHDAAGKVDRGASKKRPFLAKLAGGLNVWNRAHGREFPAWEDIEEATMDQLAVDPEVAMEEALEEDLSRVSSGMSDEGRALADGGAPNATGPALLCTSTAGQPGS